MLSDGILSPGERHPYRAGRGGRGRAVPHRRRAAPGHEHSTRAPAPRSFRGSRSCPVWTSPTDCGRRTDVPGSRSTASPVDLRVSTLPASHGEKVVIRILNAKATVLTLVSLGMSEDERATIGTLLNNKEGVILVTGPTGSGKTTTLYSMLRMVQSEGVNIVTVEDPVEYRLGKGIVQVQVHEKAGLTFAAALRSILRQDPDVVLVGEIRDQETAQIAVQASLTGHLVLSTLHTNDAPNAVTRLVDMGIEAYKLGSALRGVIAQRLMRRLCTTCREVNDQPPPERIRRYHPRRHGDLPAARLPRVLDDRLQGPLQRGRSAHHERRPGEDHRCRCHGGQDRRGGTAATACCRCSRAGSVTCWPARPASRSCSAWSRSRLPTAPLPHDSPASSCPRCRPRHPSPRPAGGGRGPEDSARVADTHRFRRAAGNHDASPQAAGGRSDDRLRTAGGGGIDGAPRRTGVRGRACSWWTTRTRCAG